MNVTLHTRASSEFIRQLERAFGAGAVTIVDSEDAAGLRRALPETEILLHVLVPVTAAMLAEAPRLRLIQKVGVGVNTIDLAAAKQRGIAVCNMPGSNTEAVAEHTLALLFATLRRIPALAAATAAGHGWEADEQLLDSAGELSGRTVGLVGLGHIGQRLAPVLAALGATVLYSGCRPKPALPYSFVALDELFRRSDIVSLHVPLTDDTRHLVNARRLASMPRGAILINTARGGLVDEAALLGALVSGQLRGAGLDVFETEPLPADSPLLPLPQVVATPHIAWLTPETLRRSMEIAAENSRRLAAGEPLLHRVL